MERAIIVDRYPLIYSCHSSLVERAYFELRQKRLSTINIDKLSIEWNNSKWSQNQMMIVKITNETILWITFSWVDPYGDLICWQYFEHQTGRQSTRFTVGRGVPAPTATTELRKAKHPTQHTIGWWVNWFVTKVVCIDKVGLRAHSL